MDDILSFALTEAGLDEFFLSNSNDGFIDGQCGRLVIGWLKHDIAGYFCRKR